ncbi:MAG: formate--tetrahydrofolate ligase, partial [Gemmatimonadota bacterium]
NWKRAVDMNDRALRSGVVGLGGPTGSVPREEGWLITAASEIMAIFCLALDLDDFEERVKRIVIGNRPDGSMVRAGELGVEGALTLLMKDALAPNLVQTIEGGPALIHGGPFANIAHGCNSLIATRAGMALGDIVVTEAGFGSDLGAEKFFDIKCRMGGLEPEAAVIVATIRAMKHHEEKVGDGSGPAGLGAGLENLRGHVENVRQFGVTPIVAVNQFADDTKEEIAAVVSTCEEWGVRVAPCDIWAKGGEGGIELAETLLAAIDAGESAYRPVYGLDTTIEEKLEAIVRNVYGGDGVVLTPAARKMADQLVENGLGDLPVCVAKTQYSFSDDPSKAGRPSGFEVTVRELRVSAGAGFIVALTGDVMVMPGLPATPAAEAMKVHADGTIEGLF